MPSLRFRAGTSLVLLAACALAASPVFASRITERLDELDLGVRQRHEHRDHAMLGQRHCSRNVGATVAIDPRGLHRIGNCDRHVIEPSDHVVHCYTTRTFT